MRLRGRVTPARHLQRRLLYAWLRLRLQLATAAISHALPMLEFPSKLP